jgi:hypothetical protein
MKRHTNDGHQTAQAAKAAKMGDVLHYAVYVRLMRKKTKATERYKSLPLSQAPHFTLSLYSYVRISHKNQSFFIMCVPTQTVLSLKYQVAQCLQEQQHEDAPSSATVDNSKFKPSIEKCCKMTIPWRI